MRRLLLTAAAAILPLLACAHPQPDVPVRTYFDGEGGMEVCVEIDPRCFAEVPDKAAYTTNQDFAKMSEADRTALKTKVAEFAKRTMEVLFDPQGKMDVPLAFEFTTLEGKPFEKPDDPVVGTGKWKTKLPDGLKSYRIHAIEGGTMAVVFRNFYKGRQLERFGILFPGETSFAVEPATLASAAIAEPAPANMPAADVSTSEPKAAPAFSRMYLVAGILVILAIWMLAKGKKCS